MQNQDIMQHLEHIAGVLQEASQAPETSVSQKWRIMRETISMAEQRMPLLEEPMLPDVDNDSVAADHAKQYISHQ